MNKEDCYIGMNCYAEVDGGICKGEIVYMDEESCQIDFGDIIGIQWSSYDGIQYEITN